MRQRTPFVSRRPLLSADIVRLLMICLIASATPAASAREAPPASPVHFPTSCSARVTPDFDRAVELLHSFEYPESERLFRSILKSEPDCGMARWGVAMNLWHPLWAPPDDAALETGAAMLADIERSTLSPRETDYLEALSLFFADHHRLSHDARALEYQARMERVYADHLDDPEAALFYALSLLATADPTDKSYHQQYKAASLLNWVGASRPRHPGVLHYLIHSYDFPGLAHLALPAALTYAEVAPDSAHAQHMPSHIFTRLGMWGRSIDSNRDSTASAADYTRRAHLPGHYDEGIHSIDYLMYALLQTARDDDARRLLDDLERIDAAHPENFKVAYTYASAPARLALERRQWAEASSLDLHPSGFPWESFGWAKSIHYFARGIGAARSGQLDQAKEELAEIEALRSTLSPDTLLYWREQVLVHVDALCAWIALAEGDSRSALNRAAAAADREDAVDKHPVTPGEVLPARELLADMLLQLGDSAQALAQYRIVLARAPNRLNALVGAARSAGQAGDAAAAAGYYEQIVRQTRSGNDSRKGVREARAHRPG